MAYCYAGYDVGRLENLIMKISINTGSFTDFDTLEPQSLADLAKFTTEFNYSLSTFSDNYRKLENFIQTEFIGLDYDNAENETQLTLEEAKKVFKDYIHIILTSKSHQKEKNGRVVDRFRVILKLQRPITYSTAEFTATWHSLAKLFPLSDSKCKDASRYWFKSPSIVSVNEKGFAIKVVSPPKPKPESATRKSATKESKTGPLKPERKGALAKATIEFISSGAQAGAWNHSLYKAAKDLQQQMYSQEEAVTMLEIPTRLPANDGSLDAKDLDTIKSAFSSEAKYNPRYNDKSNTRLIIERCHLIVNLNDIDHTHLVDLETGQRFNNISRRGIKEVLGPKKFDAYMESKAIHANFIYDPYTKSLISNQRNGIPAYNTYTPPVWLLPSFYNQAAQSPSSTLSPMLSKFLDHLVDGDGASLEYLFDWLHTALLSRNYTMLTAIGEQGIGKGVLGNLMSKLVGSSNYVQTRDEIFKKSFNKQLEGKRLVYVDELALNKKEAHDRMKHMVNETLEIEAKGKDTKYIENHASFYLSSNQFDAIQLQPGDRRFSIIQLTDKRLLDTFSNSEIQHGILGPAAVKSLGLFLLNREVKRDMRIPFKSERFEEVLDASLKSWQRFILENLGSELKGNRLDLVELKSRLRTEFPTLTPPGRGKLTALTKSYPDKLKIVCSTDNKRYMKFLT